MFASHHQRTSQSRLSALMVRSLALLLLLQALSTSAFSANISLTFVSASQRSSDTTSVFTAPAFDLTTWQDFTSGSTATSGAATSASSPTPANDPLNFNRLPFATSSYVASDDASSTSVPVPTDESRVSHYADMPTTSNLPLLTVASWLRVRARLLIPIGSVFELLRPPRW